MTGHDLTVAIATTSQRLALIDLGALPRIDGVMWQVFCQGRTDGAEDPVQVPQRPDLALVRLESQGAANSRNAALETVQSEFLLFADDDLTFSASGIRALRDRFRAAPGLAILCLRLDLGQGNASRRHPTDETGLRWYNAGRLGTPELAVRPARIRAAGVRFDPRFGAGQPDWLGDEYIFLCDALRAGLTGQHVDITIASHPHQSSGEDWSAASLEVRRKVLIRALGRWRGFPARLAYSVKHWPRIQSLVGLWTLLRP